MGRSFSVLAAVVVCATSCAEVDEQQRAAEYHETVLSEVLQSSLEWLGRGPAPTSYCVAIAQVRDDVPSHSQMLPMNPVLLERLHGSWKDLTFYPLADCSETYRYRSPTGERAGVLWVDPFVDGAEAFSAGWGGLREATAWICHVTEGAGDVKSAWCDLDWET